MKKIISLLTICLILTGCSKSMECSYKKEDENKKTEKTYIIKSKTKNIKTIDYTVNYDILNKEYKPDFDMMMFFMQADLEKYNVKYDYEEGEGKVKLNVHYDFSKLDDEALSELIGTRKFNEFKQRLVNDGFTCK